MERKDLIFMASEAGFGKLLTGDGLPTMWHWADLGMLERFAELVSAAEREACAKVCDDTAEHYGQDGGHVADHCSLTIRARSNA